MTLPAANGQTVPKLESPVVLVHGLLGYDELKLFGLTLKHYFPGIPEVLRSAGNKVLVPRLSPTSGIRDRANELRDFLQREVPGGTVHLIAHSMGGLDCRYLISCLGMERRVRSLTTIGTPHRGSSFADWCLERFSRVLQPLLDRLGIPYQAFFDLTTESCLYFNETVLDADNVRYFSVAGVFEPTWLHPEWKLPHDVVFRSEGPNDGVVSVASASYGEHTEIWQGDHLSLVNWSSPAQQVLGNRIDRIPQYVDIVRRLSALEKQMTQENQLV
ncbi:MAG: lipase [Gemmatales bacterium]|nr:MAG: lipase [Gemmatales bacterium]